MGDERIRIGDEQLDFDLSQNLEVQDPSGFGKKKYYFAN
jgi:hypothetical protein